MSAETGDFCPVCGTWLEGVVIDHERDDGEPCTFGPDDPEWVGWLEDQVVCSVCGEGARPGEPLGPGDGTVGVHPGCRCAVCFEVFEAGEERVEEDGEFWCQACWDEAQVCEPVTKWRRQPSR